MFMKDATQIKLAYIVCNSVIEAVGMGCFSLVNNRFTKSMISKTSQKHQEVPLLVMLTDLKSGRREMS